MGFPAYFRNFCQEFLFENRHIMGTANLHLRTKNQKKLMSQSRKKLVKGDSPKKRKSVIYDEKEIWEKLFRPHFRVT